MENTLGAFMAVGPVVLASGSPRRRELLGSLGIEFEVLPGREPEPDPEPGEDPWGYALRAARAKADEAAAQRPEAVVLGADTVVALNGGIMGKPENKAHAVDMLMALTGQVHEVITGCALLPPEGLDKRAEVFAVASKVHMPRAPRKVLKAYVATGEPADKAGAYAIQGMGAFLVSGVEGSYTNVVGLPLTRVLEVLVDWGVVVPRQG